MTTLRTCRPPRHLVPMAIITLLCASTLTASTSLPRSTPAERQMDGAALDSALYAAADLGFVRGMVVVRDGFVVAEESFSGSAATVRQSRSVTKSVTSMLVGIAIDQGFISGIGASMVDYLPPGLIPSDPAKRAITIGHLLTMTSGLQWDEDEDVVDWLYGSDPVGDILERDLVSTPGSSFNYNTAATHLLSVVISEATGMSTIAFADANLFGPLGITTRLWQITGGYENGGHGLHVSTEDLAKLGVLFVDGGMWGEQRILSRYWVNRSTYPDVYGIGSFGPLAEIHYGWLWWLDRGTDYQAFTAWGWGGQFIFCVPALNLVVSTHTYSEVGGDRANVQEAAVLDIIVNQVLPATVDRRQFRATGLEVPELTAIDELARDLMVEHEIRDITTAVVKDGRLVLARGYTLGEPEVETIESTALFRVGSIGKSLASAAIHRLIEEGLTSYDTLVRTIVDSTPLPGRETDPRYEQVTVDHLLTHTSGLYSEDNIYEVTDAVSLAAGTPAPCTREEIISYIVGHPFVFDPGTAWDYNNYGYAMLEIVLEEATGTPYVDFLKTQLFEPIGVGRARRAHMLEIELAPTEPGYDGLEGDPYSSPLETAAAAGGMVMSAPDMARFYSALFDRSTDALLLSQSTIDEMLELPFPANRELGYGRGWIDESLIENMGVSLGDLADPSDGLRLAGHTGGGGGVATFAFWREDGLVFVMFSNKDPVAERIEFPEISVWPDHDLWSTVGISDAAAPPSSTEAWIPVVAQLDGAAGSQWRSDVAVLNRSTLESQVRLRLYQDGSIDDLDLEIAPGEQRSISDLVGAMGRAGAGPLRIFSSEPVSVVSRTYNQDTLGTFGQNLDATESSRALSSGQSAVLMGLRENQAARSNIGIMNGWKRIAEVRVDLYDGSGELVTTIQQEIQPEQTVQLNRPFFNNGGRADVDSGYALVRVDFGQQILVYGSVVDNGTNDPTTMPAKSLTAATEQWIAAAARADGANQSQWRTDLSVLNLSGATAAVELRFHGDDGRTTSTQEMAADGTQLLLEDVVGRLGREGAGSIQILSDRPVLVTSRTFNQDQTGSFGQVLDGLEIVTAASAGERRWLPGLAQSQSFRTNIGLLNTGDAEARVRIHLFDAQGHEIATPSRVLAPGQRLQLQEPFSNIAHRDDLDSAYAAVEVRAGAGVHCYASVIDNATNDPTTVAGRR